MMKILIISVILVIVVLLLSVLAISKGYQYKHTVDELPDNPSAKNKNEEETDRE